MPFIYYREAGSGHPIVFLHGFCDSHELWDEFTSPFERTCHVIAPDLPGFGKSELLTLPFSIDQVADALAQWFSALKLDPVLVVGHSLGGYIALSLMERHAEKLAGIVLFHSTAYADSAERRLVRDKVIAFVGERGVAPFIETFVPGLFANKNHPAIPTTRLRTGKTNPESLMGYAAAMRDRPDRSGLLVNSGLPVLIISGVKDVLIPVEDLRKLTFNAPKTQLFELQESAHMGMFEAKNQAQNILSSYIEEIWHIKGT